MIDELASIPVRRLVFDQGEASDQLFMFYDKLRAAHAKNDSWLCVGLDPSHIHQDDTNHLIEFCSMVIESTADLTSAYKPNLGYFLQHGEAGLSALKKISNSVPKTIPVILDAKFGDIDISAERYARFAFSPLQVTADAVTVNPYIGVDALRPFLSLGGVFALCRTSNVHGNEFQSLIVDGQQPLFQYVAAQMAILGESYRGQLGLVVGATQPDDIKRIRETAPQLPFLVPGIGAQGGKLEPVVQYGSTIDGIGPVINIGRGITDEARRVDGSQKVRQKAIEYRDQINRLRDKHG